MDLNRIQILVCFQKGDEPATIAMLSISLPLNVKQIVQGEIRNAFARRRGMKK